MEIPRQFENMWQETEDIVFESDPGASSTFCEHNLIVPDLAKKIV